jgi:hypothetical protein
MLLERLIATRLTPDPARALTEVCQVSRMVNRRSTFPLRHSNWEWRGEHYTIWQDSEMKELTMGWTCSSERETCARFNSAGLYPEPDESILERFTFSSVPSRK